MAVGSMLGSRSCVVESRPCPRRLQQRQEAEPAGKPVLGPGLVVERAGHRSARGHELEREVDRRGWRGGGGGIHRVRWSPARGAIATGVDPEPTPEPRACGSLAPMPVRTEPGLLERAAELDEIEAALRDARAGTGALVVVEGPAGIARRGCCARRASAASASACACSPRAEP